MSYHPPSTENDLLQLKRSLGVVRQVARFTPVGINVGAKAYGVGSTAFTKTLSNSLFSLYPVPHTITTVGIYNHISLQGGSIKLTGSDSSLTLDYIDGVLNDGTAVIVRPDKGKSATLNKATDTTGNTGNLYLDSNITLAENEYLILVWYKDLGSKGMWAIPKSASGGSGTLWSGITIDVTKNMLGFGLTDLGPISFDNSDSRLRQIEGFSGSGMEFDLGTITETVGAGEKYIFNKNGTTILYIDEFGLNMQDFPIVDIHELDFVSTGNLLAIQTSGDGKVMNFIGDGKAVMNLSRNTGVFVNQTVLEVMDKTGSGNPVAMKLDYLPSTPVTGSIGEYDFDGLTNTSRQQSFAKIVGKAIDITNSAFIGEIQFLVGNASGNIVQVMNVEGGPSSSTPIGLNMLLHPIYGVSEVDFSTSGNPIAIQTSGDGLVMDFITDGHIAATLSRNIPGGQGAVFQVAAGSSGLVTAEIKALLNQIVGNNAVIGGYFFDGLNNASTQLSFAEILGLTIKTNTGAEVGEIRFDVVNNASGGLKEMLYITQDATKGIGFDFRSNALYGMLSWKLVNGSSATEDTINEFLQINVPSSYGIRFEQTGNPFLDFSTGEIKPYSVLALGDSSHMFSASYVQQYFINGSNQYMTADVSGNILFSQSSNKIIQFQFGGNDYVDIDSNNGFLYLKRGMGLEILDILGHAGQIFKSAGSFPLEIACSDGIQFDNNVTPISTTPTIGTASHPWGDIISYQFDVRDPVTSSNLYSTYISPSGGFEHYVIYDLQNIAGLTSLGFRWSLSGNPVMSLVPDSFTGGNNMLLNIYQGATYTNAHAGGASALPSTPSGYLIIGVNGSFFKLPYYAL